MAYASRKLTDAERRYGRIEKEALAITWACGKFDFYLVGRRLEIEMDHKPLISILRSKDLSELPLRIERFKMRLMRYCYDIFHMPGIKMFIADLLSRPPTKDEADKISRVEMHIQSLLSAEEDNLIEEIKVKSVLDKEYQDIVKFIREGWPGELKGEMRQVKGSADLLSEKNGMVMMNNRLYTPKKMRTQMLGRLRSGTKA